MRRPNIVQIGGLAVTVGLVLLLAGCPEAGVKTTIGTNQAAETTAVGDVNTTLGTGSSSSTPFFGSTALGSGVAEASGTQIATVDQLDGQTFSLFFENGALDENTIASAIALWVLSDAADNSTAYVQDTELANGTDWEAEVQVSGANSQVDITVDLGGVSASTYIEVAIDGSELTANGGTKTLNQDEDDVPGETGEDDLYLYLLVTGATNALATGDFRNPLAQVAEGAVTAPAEGDTTFQVTGIADTEGTQNAVTYASTEANVGYASYAADGTWTAQTATESNFAGGNVDIALSGFGSFSNGNIIRRVVDRYNYSESAAVDGFTHRRVYDQTDATVRYSTTYFSVGNLGSILFDPANTDFGLAINPTADSGLAASTQHSVTVNGTEYTFTTGTAPVSYVDVVDLLNAVTSFSANFTASLTGLGGAEDIVITSTDNSSSGPLNFAITAGTTGTDLVAALGVGGAQTNRAVVDPTSGGNNNNRYVEVALSGPSTDTTTLNSDSIRVFNTTNGEFEPWTSLESINDNVVRLHMYKGFDTTGVNMQIIVTPQARDGAGIPYGDTGNQDVALISNTFQF